MRKAPVSSICARGRIVALLPLLGLALMTFVFAVNLIHHRRAAAGAESETVKLVSDAPAALAAPANQFSAPSKAAAGCDPVKVSVKKNPGTKDPVAQFVDLSITNADPRPNCGLTIPYAAGVPTTAAVDFARKSPTFAAMEKFSNAFLAANKEFVAQYSKHWSSDPFHAWSRQYEYIWHGEALLATLPAALREAVEGTWPTAPAPASVKPADFNVMDAGSGYTFFDQFLASRLGVKVTAVDFESRYVPWFNGISTAFTQADGEPALPRIPYVMTSISNMSMFSNGVFDAITSVSVLEHIRGVELKLTLAELHRVLKPGGIIVMTFDTGQPPIAMNIEQTRELLEGLRSLFAEDTSFAPPKPLATDNSEYFTNIVAHPPTYTEFTFTISAHIFRKK